jgi:hypothetical protein
MVKSLERNKQIRDAQKRFRQRKRALMVEYLKTHPCVDCGNPDPRVLEFDHRRDKKFTIGAAVSSGHVSWGKILVEIDKCDVRCANCHRIRHAVENNWYDFPKDVLVPKKKGPKPKNGLVSPLPSKQVKA